MIEASVLVLTENCLASAWISQDSGATPSLMDVWHIRVLPDISLPLPLMFLERFGFGARAQTL